MPSTSASSSSPSSQSPSSLLSAASTFSLDPAWTPASNDAAKHKTKGDNDGENASSTDPNIPPPVMTTAATAAAGGSAVGPHRPQKSILIINGPNVNLIGGRRQRAILGHSKLQDILEACQSHAKALNVSLHTYHSNHEGNIVDAIHKAGEVHIDGIVINAGALASSSISTRDALHGVGIPYVEVRFTNIFGRQPWRQNSYLSEHSCGVIIGLGAFGYRVAMEHLAYNVIPRSKLAKL